MIRKGLKKVWGYLCMGVVALSGVFGNVAMAADATIPAMPVDFGALATEAVAIVGTVLGAVAGIIIVIALVRMGFRFLTRAFTGNV